MEQAPRHPVPVFPLPDFVLFPDTSVPLHVFELRYRTMVRDALSLERMIALALLKPGPDSEYEGSPEFHGLGCLARFEDVEWLPNDCYNLVVTGVARVRFERIVREFPYRSARVEILPQAPYSEDDPLVLSEKHAVIERLSRLSPQAGGPGEPAPAPGAAFADRLRDARYESLVNALCMRVDAGAEERLALLALDSVIERGRCARELAARRPRPRREPPAGAGDHN